MTLSKLTLRDATLACVLMFAFILVSHGGTGYQQSTLAVWAGALLLCALAAWWLVQSGLRMTISHLLIAMTIVLLMYVPAVLGLLEFGVKAGFTFMVFNLLTFVLFSQLVSRYCRRSEGILCAAFIMSALLCSLFALIVMLHPVQIDGLQFGKPGYFRLVGPFSTPNRFGEAPAVGALVSFCLFARPGGAHRVRYGLLTLAFALFTLGSGSKGVLLGLVAALAIGLMFTRVARMKVFVRGAVAMLPLAGLLIYLFYDYFLLATKLDQIEDGTLDVGSGRSVIWGHGLDLYIASPFYNQIFGHGSTAFVTRIGVDAHSMFWNLLVDYGLLPLLALACLFAYLGVALVTRRVDRTALILGSSLIVFGIARGISMPTIFDNFNFAMLAFWAGMALVFTSVPRGRVEHV